VSQVPDIKFPDIFFDFPDGERVDFALLCRRCSPRLELAAAILLDENSGPQLAPSQGPRSARVSRASPDAEAVARTRTLGVSHFA